MPRVLVEISGGVDSAVCAYLLLKQGYEVIGVMMNMHNDIDPNPAKDICEKLNIEFKFIDLKKEFKENVIDYFANTYMQALTPNPCIMCNIKMKFGKIFDIAKDLDCEKIATGHYAQIIDNKLYKAKDENKDQSYVLHFLDKEKLNKILLPLGKYTKPEILSIANKLGIKTEGESQDICFIKNETYADYIKKHYKYEFKPGNIKDEEGNILGQHNGLINYTIGQRKGLGVALGKPVYVTKLDNKNNEVVLGNKTTNTVYVKDFVWIDKNTVNVQAKLRYRQKQIPCTATIENEFVKLEFDENIESSTPGQYAVIYNKDQVLGGGVIC